MTVDEYVRRIAEIRAENAAACPGCAGCGCRPSKPCHVAISEEEHGVCARIAGVDVCSACLVRQEASAA